MITRRLLLGSTSALLAQIAHAQKPGGTAKPIFTNDLPDLTLKGWAATAVEVSYGPGEGSSAHRHPGITIAYVLEGEIRSKIGDGPEKIYKAGEMFLETPNQLHGVSANASATRPAKLLGQFLQPR